MHAKKQNWWHQPYVTLIETKESMNLKPNIKIKFRLHQWISDNKNFEARSHLTIFWQAFYIHIFNYGYKFYYHSNKTNEVPEQMRTTVRTSLYVIPNNKCGVRTNRNKGQTHVNYRQSKILLYSEQLIIIAKTSLYVISNEKMSEQMRTTVRMKSYYSQNNFVCHLEQKQI
jgi:hypothetical protein